MSLKFISKKNKFSYINELLSKLNKINKCNSIVDIGCSSGLTSLIALNNNFKEIVSLDHDPEYIKILTKIKKYCNISNIEESIYSFGNVLNKRYDIVFCGAIIHWIFSLTADFRNFDSIIKYLVNLTNNYLIIEWISENDSAIKHFGHIRRRQNSKDEI